MDEINIDTPFGKCICCKEDTRHSCPHCGEFLCWAKNCRSYHNEKSSTSDWQKMVEDFHAKFGVKVGIIPHIDSSRIDLRENLMREELEELLEALRSNNLPEAIDGLCDLIYVVLGTAVTFGIPIEPFFQEVHRTNMMKVNGSIRDDGKILKPEGWEPPNIEGILKRILDERQDMEAKETKT